MKNEFKNKTKEYVKGRPTYPAEVLKVMSQLGVNHDSTIADIGAGTGILTHMLGNLGCSVVAIEPSEQMVEECKVYCEDVHNIKIIKASAEETTLMDNSVDVITVAQAFHWFDKELCKPEFQRILKEDGYVVIVWNDMQLDSPLAKEYTQLLKKYTVKTTAAIAKFNPDEKKRQFFGQDYTKMYYDNWQTVSEEEFVAGALSLSYTPSELDSTYDEFVTDLRELFSNYQQDERVMFYYKTEVCICQFAK
ncbi:class I SAM-dependent methyltransferase [Priestia koreensis]|uniref:class I SAM-dependent methyltransferase n=1 Tax=Priestia koreensis TaxID=284581 RepID=UPI003CFC8B14